MVKCSKCGIEVEAGYTIIPIGSKSTILCENCSIEYEQITSELEITIHELILLNRKNEIPSKVDEFIAKNREKLKKLNIPEHHVKRIALSSAVSRIKSEQQ